MLYSICQQIWKTQQRPQNRKRWVFIPVSKKGNAKECSKLSHSCSHFTCYSKVMLKILQARLQHYMHGELPDVQVGFRKAEEPEIKVPTLVASWRKHRNSRKTSTSASLRLLKPLTVWITTNCGKFLKRWEYQTTLPASWETCMQVKKQQLELDIEKQTGSKLLYAVTLLI